MSKKAWYFAVIFALVLSACSQRGAQEHVDTQSHVVVGKWTTMKGLANHSVAFYEDGVGAFDGLKMNWKPVNVSTVRVETEYGITEFSIGKNNAGQLIGTFDGSSLIQKSLEFHQVR